MNCTRRSLQPDGHVFSVQLTSPMSLYCVLRLRLWTS